MVKAQYPLYLFIGQDSLSKEIKLKQLKQEFFPKDIEQFNFDTLYAKELDLKVLQERILNLPVKAKRRILFIKEGQYLKDEIKKFLLGFINNSCSKTTLIIDLDHADPKDEFIKRILCSGQVYRFKEEVRLDSFVLSRQIDLKRPDYALKVLNQLLKMGEKPERILGGLRYAWERESSSRLEKRKRLKFLLNCDLEIKTGRLKPDFALEKLVISLCGLAQA